MIRDDPTTLHVRAIVNGARDGHYHLPARVHQAADRVDAAIAALTAARAATPVVPPVGVLATDADLTADPWHLAAPVIEAEDRLRAHEIGVRIIDARRDQELRAMYDTVIGADAQIVECLQDALAQVLREVPKAAATFGGDIPPAVAVAHLPKGKQDAWYRLDRFAGHYDGIRDAQWRLRVLTGSPESDMYVELDPLHEQTWGEKRWRARHMSTWTPWPEGRLERLLWLASLPDGVVFVLPGDEADARAETFAKAMRPRAAASALGVWGG